MKFKPMRMAAAAAVAGVLTVGGVSMAMAQEDPTTTVPEEDTTTVPEDDTTTVPDDGSTTDQDRANCDHGSEDSPTTEGS